MARRGQRCARARAGVTRKKKSRGSAPASPPVAPRLPLPEECCGQGCTPCVYDLYEQELEKYRAALEARRSPKKKSF